MAHKKNPPLSKRAYFRYWFIGTVYTLVVAVVLYNIVYTMFFEGAKWRAIASTLRLPDKTVVAPTRGTIYSLQGEVLAISAPTDRLFLDCRSEPILLMKKKYPDSLNNMLDAMAQLLSEKYRHLQLKSVTSKALKSRWQQGLKAGDRHCILIPVDVGYADYKELRTQYPFVVRNTKGKSVRSALRSSIYAESKSVRMNPFGELAYRTIGAVYGAVEDGGITRGKNGIELAYDSLLCGSPGSAINRYVGGRNTRNVLEEAIAGASVYTTLDMNLQYIVDQSLREKLIEMDAARGSAALMEVETGRIVAITNLARVASGRYAETQNYIVSDLTEPGSTFKTPIMMAALEDGVVYPEEVMETGNGLYKVGRRTIRDHNAHRGGYGTISVEKVIWYSSNVGMVKIVQKGYRDNPERLISRLRDYGFGTDLKLEIPGYAVARVFTPQDTTHLWTQETLHSMSYGYEVQIPPIYTLNFYNAIAGGGRLMKPYFVEKVLDYKSKELYRAQPKVLNESICSPSVLAQIKDMLNKVVESGTGKPVQSPIVRISGKTGTAVISQGSSGYNSGGRRYMASFCGYFPSEKPKYTCIVIVTDPKGSSSGGYVAGAVVRRIAEQIQSQNNPILLDTVQPLQFHPFNASSIIGGEYSGVVSFMQQRGVPWVEESKIDKNNPVRVHKTDKGYLVGGSASFGLKLMPNVIGLDPATAVFELMRRGVMVNLQGYGMVVEQSIPVGESLLPGRMVTLRLGKNTL